MPILPSTDADFTADVPIAIIGAGACGLIAALAANDAGADVVVLERDSVPQGSTALSSGMIPACRTRAQANAGIADTPELMAADLKAKAHGLNDTEVVQAVSAASGPAIDWLAESHGVDLTLVEGFLYPGHSALRMHAPPSRTGADLIGALTRAVEAREIPVMTDALVTDLFAMETGEVAGLRLKRPDGSTEDLGCRALILACNGFGGNPAMLAELIPEMAEANYFGHTGNQGDALLWGEALGTGTGDLGSYQGHGSVAHPHGILISWALMMGGGIQVNCDGLRFSNEHDGYSEQARRVLAQPDHLAWCIYDARLHELGLGFEDYRNAESAGAIQRSDNATSLAEACGLPVENLENTISDVAGFAVSDAADPFGRDFTGQPALAPPYFAVRVTGSLFHTQGGLIIDPRARVLSKDGTPLPNLYAGGGAARGLSGPGDWGYLSGNGLLNAVFLGRIAGCEAAKLTAG